MSAETAPGANRSNRAVVEVNVVQRDVATVLPSILTVDVCVDAHAVRRHQSAAVVASVGKSVTVPAVPLRPPKSSKTLFCSPIKS